MLEVNKIYNQDCTEGFKELDDDSVDCIITDPPYGLTSLRPAELIENEEKKGRGFMGKEWDVIPTTKIWAECLRVLKPGAFAFIMCIPRQDCQLVMQYRLMMAGFNISFSPIYHAFASGFPKSMNISLMIDKQACTKQLTEKLGRKPTKGEFKEAWSKFREVVGKEKVDIGMQSGSMHAGRRVEVIERDITVPTTPQAKALEGTYTFNPKPALELILVCQKPLKHKSYVAQALDYANQLQEIKDGKRKTTDIALGSVHFDDCRIPFESDEDKDETKWEGKHGFGNSANDYGKGLAPDHFEGNQKGRFPSHLLVSDDALNDGVERVCGKCKKNTQGSMWQETQMGGYKENAYIGDSGSFSRYFSLDSWFSEQIEKLPKNIRKTFPFLITPKASRQEKNEGLEGMPLGEPPASGRSKPAEGRKNALGEPRANFHCAVKPISLMSYLITLGSRPNDIILDPFIGSGTTAIACQIKGRKYIGFEIDEDYYKIAQARLNRGLGKFIER